MANRFSIQPASGLSGFQALSAGIGKRAEFEIEKAAQAKDLQKRQEGTEILKSGDIDRIQSFMLENPDIAADVDKAYQFKNQVTEDNAIKTAWDIYMDKKPASQALIERADVVLAEGGDASGTLQLAEQAQIDPSIAKSEAALLLMRKDPAAWKLYQESQEVEGEAGASTDLSRYANLIEDQYAIDNPGKTIPPKLKADAMMKLKRASPDEVSKVTMSKLLAELQLKPLIRGAETSATGVETRASSLIDRGLLAAESTAVIRRGLELLDSVKTGGLDNVNLLAKRFFGVEGANEGELSNALGKAVLSQLRETFGAQFTQEEGNRLIRLEAGFSKSVANNRRILGQALRMAERTSKRARKAAKDRGDMATVSDIDELLLFSLSVDETAEPQQTSELSDDELFKAAGMQ
jgi:hypothetical protein